MRIEEEKGSVAGNILSGKQITLIVGMVVVLVTGIWGYSRFRLKHITVEGLTRYTQEEFQEKISGGIWNSLTPLFCLSDTMAQETIPFVECYEIDYVDQQTARVIVHEKRVTGCVVIMGKYMYFDKDGIVVESLDRRVDGIPVVTGLEFCEIVLYQKLNVQKESLFDTILQLTKLIDQKQLGVQEIAFDSGYAVTLYADDIEILLGKQADYDEAVNALPGILAAMEGRAGILDMRNYNNEHTDVILKEQ